MKKFHDVTICLDLDMTLVYVTFHADKINNLEKDPVYEKYKNKFCIQTLVDPVDKSKKGYGKSEKFLLFYRPYVKEFIKYLFDNFGEVHIWSAAHFRYVRALEYLIFPEDRTAKKVLSKQHCEIGENYVLKDLSTQGYDLSKTIIIDDRDDTFSNNPDNAIHIPEFKPNGSPESLENQDDCLLKIMEFFDRIDYSNVEDIRTINKRIFFE